MHPKIQCDQAARNTNASPQQPNTPPFHCTMQGHAGNVWLYDLGGTYRRSNRLHRRTECALNPMAHPVRQPGGVVDQGGVRLQVFQPSRRYRALAHAVAGRQPASRGHPHCVIGKVSDPNPESGSRLNRHALSGCILSIICPIQPSSPKPPAKPPPILMHWYNPKHSQQLGGDTLWASPNVRRIWICPAGAALFVRVFSAVGCATDSDCANPTPHCWHGVCSSP